MDKERQVSMSQSIVQQMQAQVNSGKSIQQAIDLVVPGADVEHWEFVLAGKTRQSRNAGKANGNGKPNKTTNYAEHVLWRQAGHGYTAEVLADGTTRYVDDKPTRPEGATHEGTNPFTKETEWYRPHVSGCEVSNGNGWKLKTGRMPEWVRVI